MKQLIYCLTAFWAIILMLSACNEIETTSLHAQQGASWQNTFLAQDVYVSRTEANNIADFFFRSNSGNDLLPTKSEGSRSNLISTSETIREDGQDLMYVFNYEDGGFVIVGSTRNYYPILAYSDKGSFELSDDMGPVDVWIDETKVCLKNSPTLDDATKAQMQQLWARFDGTYTDPTQDLLATRRPQTRSTGEDYCWERIEALQTLYGDEGWTFLPLSQAENVFDEAGLSSYYSAICYSAEQNHSALNETVIGYINPVVNQVGRLLTTDWHGASPFNDFCPVGCQAGCGPIAVAQVMKYHQFPPSITWSDYTFGWSDVPAIPNYNSTDRHGQLIRYLWQLLQITVHPPYLVATNATKIKTGLESINYSVTIRDPHTELSVRDSLLSSSKPIIMYGRDSTETYGHFWVCEGVYEIYVDKIVFYTENQPYGAGSFTQGMYTYANPGMIGGTTPLLYFYMNWGYGSTPIFSPNGWYLSNNVGVDGYNYKNDRKDLFISAP